MKGPMCSNPFHHDIAGGQCRECNLPVNFRKRKWKESLVTCSGQSVIVGNAVLSLTADGRPDYFTIYPENRK